MDQVLEGPTWKALKFLLEKKMVRSIVVDECQRLFPSFRGHLYHQLLCLLRDGLGAGASEVALGFLSGTMNNDMILALKKKTGLKLDVFYNGNKGNQATWILHKDRVKGTSEDLAAIIREYLQSLGFNFESGDDKVLVLCPTINLTCNVHSHLKRIGPFASPSLLTSQETQHFSAFCEHDSTCRLLVSTTKVDAGMDVRGIRFVFIIDPHSLESTIQCAGRSRAEDGSGAERYFIALFTDSRKSKAKYDKSVPFQKYLEDQDEVRSLFENESCLSNLLKFLQPSTNADNDNRLVDEDNEKMHIGPCDCSKCYSDNDGSPRANARQGVVACTRPGKTLEDPVSSLRLGPTIVRFLKDSVDCQLLLKNSNSKIQLCQFCLSEDCCFTEKSSGSKSKNKSVCELLKKALAKKEGQANHNCIRCYD